MNENKSGLKGGYAFISGDSHLEVLPERWTGRVPAKLRHLMPHTVEHPDGGDALQIEGVPLQKVNYIDLRGGRSAEDWQPFGVKVEDTAGVGPPEQRLREQDQDGCAAEVLYPNMVVGPRLWASIPSHARIPPQCAPITGGLRKNTVPWTLAVSLAWGSSPGPLWTTP
jgi:hypothetical protein